MNMINFTHDDGIDEAIKIIKRIKDDLPNIHTIADYMGDLTVTSIYYDTNTDKITFVDWSNYQPKIKVHRPSIAGQ